MYLLLATGILLTALVVWLLVLSGRLAAMLDLWPLLEEHRALYSQFPGLRAALAAQRHHLTGTSRSVAGHREQAATSPIGSSNPLGVNRAALANVRDLMATSLGRIRHLEDEVKAIPLLQEKLSLLEEEKRLLMLQLKTKSNQLGQRSVGVGDNHILGPTKKDSGGDALDEYIRKLEKQGITASPKTSFSDAKVQATVPTTSTHSMTVSTKEDASFPESPPLRPSRSLDRAKLATVQIQRAKKQFESKETATDLEAGKDVHKKLEQLTFDVCEPTSIKPEPRPCPHCEEQPSAATEVTKSRSTDAAGLERNVGVQFSPGPIRKRDVMLQADVTERRHVGLQVTTVEAKPLTVSTGTGITDVRRVVCDRCANLRQRSVAVGNHVSRRDMAVSISLQAERVSQGSGDCSVTDVLCEKCQLKQTETIGVGDFDVNCVVCDACMEKSTSEEKPPSTQSVSTAMTSSVEEPRSPGAVRGVRLCDKCSCQITSVAKDFIDKNVLDPVLPTLSSRIPKLSGRTPRKTVAPRASSVPPSSENRNALLGSLGDQKMAAMSQQQLREPPARMAERSEKHEPSKEVKAACKVLNDYLMKPERGDPNKLKTAVSLIQQEWFQISSPADADPNMVEDYMDTFEEFSRHLLHRIVNMADVNGNTAIHYAVSHGNFDVVSILLDSKVCDVSKQNKVWYTCIMLVSLAEIKNDTHRLVVQRLFQLGDVNAKAMQNGQTALMLAASHGRLEMIKLLLDAGAEPNVQDNDGSTALMCAAEHGYIEIVRVLLAHPDTEVCLADNDGSTALTIAMEAGHKDTALLIYANSNFSRGSSPHPFWICEFRFVLIFENAQTPFSKVNASSQPPTQDTSPS
ncbi:hypothetical protein HPB52_006764 [Rhipicephalus sanguineus]|uniref:Uncharacterized protein n=1 Tax=Rhipicephalus sanguineus TaxID=34632 RepID=A0A9D4PCF0_RHISA|nr:hypothetical protein HPB52_006764 [Rhipicephalus sanguineus]